MAKRRLLGRTRVAVINEEKALRMLGDVPQGKQFYCHDGRVLKNLSELAAALNEMSKETFGYHSNTNKADFSNWVREVIGDDKLARDLQKTNNQTRAARAVTNRIIFLQSKIQTARR